MELDFAFLCRYAEPQTPAPAAVRVGFGAINLEEVPGEIDRITFVSRCIIDESDTVDRVIRISLHGPDGSLMREIPERTVETPHDPNYRLAFYWSIGAFEHVRFEETGKHYVSLSIDDVEVKRIHFIVLENDDEHPIGIC